MPGTIAGAQKTKEKNLANDPLHYHKIGKKGGSKTGVKKGFAANKELARLAGAKGGSLSRRKPKDNIFNN